MKILHTSDWHLGDNFHGFDRFSEHDDFLCWLKNLIVEERPDVLVVCGDVFDNANPSARAEEQLYGFLADATRLHPGMRIIITAGNHDSGRRLQAPARLLRNQGVEIRGVVEHDEDGAPIISDLIIPVFGVNNPDDKAVVLAVPYLRSTDLDVKKSHSAAVRDFFLNLTKQARKLYGRQIPLILMAHLYAVGAEVALNEHSERLVVGGEDCVDVDGLDNDVAYVALGHIHKSQQVGGDERMVFYSGSPIPMSFSEKNYHRGVNKLIIGKNGGIVFEQVEYVPMRRLVSLPEEGAASLTEVLEGIKQLPSKQKEDADRWCYLEIKLKDTDANPASQNEILNALTTRAARLCRLIKVSTHKGEKERKRKMESLDQLRNISPLDIALDAYLQVMGEEMDDKLVERFNIAAKEAVALQDNMEN